MRFARAGLIFAACLAGCLYHTLNMVSGRVLEQAVIQIEYVSFLTARVYATVDFLVDLLK